MAVAEIEREMQVLAIFRQLLNTPSLGPEQNFFEAGGSSLLAARLAARLRSSGVLDVPTSAIFAAPSARSLVHYAGQPLPVAAPIAPSTPEAAPAIDPDPSRSSPSLERGARQRAAFARLRPSAKTTMTDASAEETR